MASEAARERAERWAEDFADGWGFDATEKAKLIRFLAPQVAALLDEHARAELEAAAEEATDHPLGLLPYFIDIRDRIRARAARIGGGE